MTGGVASTVDVAASRGTYRELKTPPRRRHDRTTARPDSGYRRESISNDANVSRRLERTTRASPSSRRLPLSSVRRSWSTARRRGDASRPPHKRPRPRYIESRNALRGLPRRPARERPPSRPTLAKIETRTATYPATIPVEVETMTELEQSGI